MRGVARGLERLFARYTDRKEAPRVLDYDDLLLYWHALLADPPAGERGPRALRPRPGRRVPGHQHAAGRDPLRGCRPDGSGLTVVGDDAQSIYAFRAATVRNILDFPEQYPGATVVTLEQNYRSTQPILGPPTR